MNVSLSLRKYLLSLKKFAKGLEANLFLGYNKAKILQVFFQVANLKNSMNFFLWYKMCKRKLNMETIFKNNEELPLKRRL